MALTPEQIARLNQITEKLRNVSQNGNSSNLPALCYALDSSILPEVDYELLKNADFSLIRDNSPSYFPAIVLIFIRNFFEKSDGRSCWRCTPTANQKGTRGEHRFVDLLDGGIFGNKLIPSTGQNIKSWLKSQCWVIKADDCGDKSGILSTNAAVLSYIKSQLRCNISNLSSEDIDKLTLPEGVPNYIQYLFKNHRKELVLSLLAIDSDDSMPSYLPKWLELLWGLKKNAIKEVQRACFSSGCVFGPVHTAEWCVEYKNQKYIPVLRLKDWGAGAAITQSQLSLSIRRDYVSVDDLVQKGFDLAQKLIIETEDEEIEVSPLLVGAKSCLVYGATGQLMPDKPKFLKKIENGDLRRSHVCVIHRNRDTPVLNYGETPCVHKKTFTTYDNNRIPYIFCSLFELPVRNEEVSYLHSKSLSLKLALRNDVNFVFENKTEVKASKNQYSEAYVIESNEKAAEVLFTCVNLDFVSGNKLKCKWKNEKSSCLVYGNEFFTPYEIEFETESGAKRVSKVVVFVPEGYFSRPRHLDLSQHGKFKFVENDCVFSGVLEQAEWIWEGCSAQQCLNESERRIRMVGPSSFINLKVNNVERKIDSVLCVGMNASEILSLLGNLIPNRIYDLYINDKLAYNGAYKPNGSCIYRNGQNMALYNRTLCGHLRIRHELFYKNYFNEEERQKYEKSYTVDRKQFQNGSHIIPPGYYQFGIPGTVIVDVVGEKSVCAEIPRRDKENSWAKDVSPDRLKAILFLMGDGAIKTTELYRELEICSSAKKIIDLSFSELKTYIFSELPERQYIAASNNGEEFLKGGYTKPTYCALSNCNFYSSRNRVCSRELLDDECRPGYRVSNPYYNENELRNGIASILATCAFWLDEDAIYINFDTLDAIWKRMQKKLRNYFQHNIYIKDITQTAMNNRWISSLYIIAAIAFDALKIFNMDIKENDKKWLAKQLSVAPAPMLKFMILVRWSSKFKK